MSLRFCSIASGSSGNCYMIQRGDAVLLVDAGVSCRKILKGLETAGATPDMVRGILITHEHSDHIRGLGTAARKMENARVYCNPGTYPHLLDKVAGERMVLFSTGKEFLVDGITVRPFSISHDASEPVGYSFFADGGQVSVLTDTGCITEDIYEEIRHADLVALEANHDKEVLKFCRYPYHIKRRILSDEGHLSNDAAGECILRLVSEGPKRRNVLLSHLSKENNTPDIARITITNILEAAGVYPGPDLTIEVITREEVSRVYRLQEEQ